MNCKNCLVLEIYLGFGYKDCLLKLSGYHGDGENLCFWYKVYYVLLPILKNINCQFVFWWKWKYSLEFHDYFTNCFTGLEQVGFTEFVTTLTDSEFKLGLFVEQNTQFFHILGIKIRVFIKPSFWNRTQIWFLNKYVSNSSFYVLLSSFWVLA